MASGDEPDDADDDGTDPDDEQAGDDDAMCDRLEPFGQRVVPERVRKW